jgi:hypothetical protein
MMLSEMKPFFLLLELAKNTLVNTLVYVTLDHVTTSFFPFTAFE